MRKNVKVVLQTVSVIVFLLVLGFCAGCVASPAPAIWKAEEWGTLENIEAMVWLQDIGVDYVAESLKHYHCGCLGGDRGHTCNR